MASLVLGVIGAAALGPVGLGIGPVLGMTGAQIGFTLGSTLGSMLFAPNMPDIQGPRLADLKVQESEYGNFIPIYYGTARGSGQVIWSTPLIETAHEEEAEGGKGGGGDSQTYTTYTYSLSCAVAVCEGPISGIRRIWANGELILDARASNSGITGRSSNIRIYGGTETQVADSLLESYLGVGNVPAHRGLSYVVFENFQLQKYGNRMPNFTFEVVKGGFVFTTVEDLAIPPKTSLISSLSNIGKSYQHPFINGLFLTLSADNGTSNPFVLHITDAINKTDRTINLSDIPASFMSTQFTYVEATNEIWVATDAEYYAYSNDVAVALDADFLTVIRKITPSAYKGFQIIGNQMFYDRSSVKVLFAQGGSTVGGGVNYLDPITLEWDGLINTDETVNWWTGNSCQGRFSVALSNFNNSIAIFSGARHIATIGSTNNEPYLTFDSSRNRYAWWDRNSGGKAVFRAIGESDYVYEEFITTTMDAVAFQSLNYIESIDKYVYSDGENFYRLNASTFEKEFTYQAYEDIPDIEIAYNFSDVRGMGEYFVGNVTSPDLGLVLFQLTNRFDTDPKILADIVKDICLRSDLTESDIDVTALEPYDCDGYVIARQMSGRAALDGLQAAFFFDAVESN